MFGAYAFGSFTFGSIAARALGAIAISTIRQDGRSVLLFSNDTPAVLRNDAEVSILSDRY